MRITARSLVNLIYTTLIRSPAIRLLIHSTGVLQLWILVPPTLDHELNVSSSFAGVSDLLVPYDIANRKLQNETYIGTVRRG